MQGMGRGSSYGWLNLDNPCPKGLQDFASRSNTGLLRCGASAPYVKFSKPLGVWTSMRVRTSDLRADSSAGASSLTDLT